MARAVTGTPDHRTDRTLKGGWFVGIWRCGWGIWLGWWSFQDGCVVIGGDDERRMVGVAGVGSWFGLVVGDGWGLSVVSAAQGTDPHDSIPFQ
jgi:hypothetical protein